MLSHGRLLAFPRALGDGSEHDTPRRLCTNVVNDLPRCMDMITVDDVIRRIELYVDALPASNGPRLHEEAHHDGIMINGREGGFVSRDATVPNGNRIEGGEDAIGEIRGETYPLRSRAAIVSGQTRASSSRVPRVDESLNVETAREAMDTAVTHLTAYPDERFSGRGVVICAGGPVYVACAWVCIQMLRRTGCTLPIELWHRGDAELPASMRALFEPLGVECVDALRIRRRYPARRLGGWELKAYALVHSRFEEVMFLDSDNVSLIDPAQLFDSREYLRHGAILWPDLGRLTKESPIWQICGISPRDEPEIESGQMLLHKPRCWQALSLALWMNEHSDFFYQHVHGDKETFHLAFRRLNQTYATPSTPPRLVKAALFQHDFTGKVIFQHRNLDKWDTSREPIAIPSFRLERTCLRHLKQLGEHAAWKSFAPAPPAPCGPPTALSKKVTAKHLVVRAPVNASTGYGLHCCQLVTDMLRLGYDVGLHPTATDETFAPIPTQVRRTFLPPKAMSAWELLLHPPHYPPRRGTKTVYFTMWESTRLPSAAPRNLNAAECVIVPCRWNAECFRESGVRREIRIVPLGIDTATFQYREMDLEGPCVFGAAGRTESDPLRKRVNEVIAVFRKAFPRERDVRLRIKVFPGCAIQRVQDSRIEITRSYLSEVQLAAWFRSLTCFVSLARAEGWGLMQHQALATGRPVIGSEFGGVAEFFDRRFGYPLKFRMVPAEGRFTGCGHWAEPSESDAVAMMRRVYRDRSEAQALGIAAARHASQWSWEESHRKLAATLCEIGMLKMLRSRSPVEAAFQSPVKARVRPRSLTCSGGRKS